jgi:hypothetical protein
MKTPVANRFLEQATHLMAWLTILTELLGGLAMPLGAFVRENLLGPVAVSLRQLLAGTG